MEGTLGLGTLWVGEVSGVVGTLVFDSTTHGRARSCGGAWPAVKPPTDKPESRDKKIAKATEKMFKNYPPTR